MGCASSQPADGAKPKPSQAQGANGPKATAGAAGAVAGAAHKAAGAAQNTAAKVANAVPGVGSKSGAPASGAAAAAGNGNGSGGTAAVAPPANHAVPSANHVAPPDQTAAGKAAGGVIQVPNGAGGSAGGGVVGDDGGLAAAAHTAAAANAFGAPTANGGGVPMANGGGASAFASPARTKSIGSPKPALSGSKVVAERPRWGSTPAAAEAQATRKGSGGRLSTAGSSPAPATPPRRRTAGEAVGGSTSGTPELQRTPSYMLATSSSKSKVFSTPPTNRSRNEGRRPYGLMEPRGNDEQL